MSSNDKTSVPVTRPGKKKRDGMGSLFKETVVSRVLEDCAANTPFVSVVNGKTVYVGILFQASDIGGLDKKSSSKDEAKGQLVQIIERGAIKTFFTEETLNNEEIVIIPDSLSVSNMEDFGMIRNISYRIVFIHVDGSLERTEKTITYADVISILNGDIAISDHLPSEFPDGDMDVDLSDQNASVNSGDIGLDDASVISSYAFVSDDAVLNETSTDDTSTDDTSTDDTSNPFSYTDESVEYDERDGDVEDEDMVYDEASEASATEDYVEEISSEQVYKAIIRKFYSDELGLEVSTEPFDIQFIHGNEYTALDENRQEGWLNNFINEKCKHANIEMSRIHKANLYKMKDFYLATMAKHCEAIQKDLDTNDATTLYGQISETLKGTRVLDTKKADETIVHRKVEVNTAWEEKLNQVAEIAAQDAKNRYRDRFGRQHDEDVLHIAPMVRDEIESTFQAEIRDLNQRRRLDALKRLDYSVNETLQEVAGKYLMCLDDEVSTYHSFEKDILDFIDVNRKDDIARANVLAEELRQSNKADAVLAEYTEKMQALNADFEAKGLQMQADIDKIQRENELMLQNKDAEWKRRYDESEHERSKQKDEINVLLNKFADLDEKKNQEFGSQINGLKSERSSWENKCDHIISTNKRTNRISVFLVVMILVAALAVGFIGGAFIYGKAMNETTNNAIVAEYNARMDALETKDVVETTAPTETTVKETKASVTNETTKSTTASSGANTTK